MEINETKKIGSLSTVVGDEKLTSREDRIGPFFMYVQCDEDKIGRASCRERVSSPV